MKRSLLARFLIVLATPALAGQPPAATPPAAAPPPAKADPAAARVTIPIEPITRFEKRGAGPIPMILAPGLACDWSVYEAFMDRNKDRYTMYAVTLPGFGGTKPPQLPAGTLADDDAWLRNAEAAIVKFAADQKLDKPVLVGHSLAGHVALRLAAVNPCPFRSVIVLDAWPAMPLSDKPISKTERAIVVNQRMLPNALTITQEQWGQQAGQLFSTMVTSPERAKVLIDMAKAVPAQTAERYLCELFAADATDLVNKITVPTLVIAAISNASPEAGKQQARDTYKDFFSGKPRTTLVYFENTRHFITEDAPAELDQAVADFTAGKPVKGKEK